jgi:hypothetical protein
VVLPKNNILFLGEKEMEKVRRNGWKLAFLALIALMCSHIIFGDAANWDPAAPPGPTMTSLDAIYSAIGTASSGIAEREGYVQDFHYTAIGDIEVVHTVPTGKRFVLLNLYVQSGLSWVLYANDNMLLHGTTINVTAAGIESRTWDFPDRCVVFNAGEQVKFGNPSHACKVALIGYHYDAP